uniref:Uncharacterized protein n=1 Tax=Fagus sylvatica TaxID=28930 RepID=A0A2N9FJ58_FAGSY
MLCRSHSFSLKVIFTTSPGKSSLKIRDGNFAPPRTDPPRPVPTRAGIPRPVEIPSPSPSRRLRFFSAQPPSRRRPPTSLTQSLTLPATSLPHAAPHSFTPPQLLAQSLRSSSLSRRRSSLSHAVDPRSVTPQISRSSLSHAAALHYNPILGAGRGDAGRSGSGAGRDKLPRPPGRGGVGYW